MTNFKVTSVTTELALTAEELRNHVLLFGDTSRDTELQEFAYAAQQYLDDHLGEFIGSTGIQAFFKDFEQPLELPHQYIKNTPTVTYYQTGTASPVTVANTVYLYDNSGNTPTIRLRDGQTWPDDVDEQYEYPILVNYNAGLTDANGLAPAAIRSAVLLIAGELYNIREQSTDRERYIVPVRAESLVRGYRRAL